MELWRAPGGNPGPFGAFIVTLVKTLRPCHSGLIALGGAWIINQRFFGSSADSLSAKLSMTRSRSRSRTEQPICIANRLAIIRANQWGYAVNLPITRLQTSRLPTRRPAQNCRCVHTMSP